MNKKDFGWIVSFWIDSSQIQLNDRDKMPYLSWSPYDRVTIDEVTDFVDFFQAKESPAWNGTVQRLHLIPMWQCEWKPGEKSLIDLQTPRREPYGLYSIITARFQRRYADVDDIKLRISEQVSDHFEGRNIQWQPFRSLGAEDFVGIFLADNVADLAEATELFKRITYTENYQKKEVFFSVYSFMGLNDPKYCQEPKADLLVRLY